MIRPETQNARPQDNDRALLDTVVCLERIGRSYLLRSGRTVSSAVLRLVPAAGIRYPRSLRR